MSCSRVAQPISCGQESAASQVPYAHHAISRDAYRSATAKRHRLAADAPLPTRVSARRASASAGTGQPQQVHTGTARLARQEQGRSTAQLPVQGSARGSQSAAAKTALTSKAHAASRGRTRRAAANAGRQDHLHGTKGAGARDTVEHQHGGAGKSGSLHVNVSTQHLTPSAQQHMVAACSRIGGRAHAQGANSPHTFEKVAKGSPTLRSPARNANLAAHTRAWAAAFEESLTPASCSKAAEHPAKDSGARIEEPAGLAAHFPSWQGSQRVTMHRVTRKQQNELHEAGTCAQAVTTTASGSGIAANAAPTAGKTDGVATPAVQTAVEDAAASTSTILLSQTAQEQAASASPVLCSLTADQKLRLLADRNLAAEDMMAMVDGWLHMDDVVLGNEVLGFGGFCQVHNHNLLLSDVHTYTLYRVHAARCVIGAQHSSSSDCLMRKTVTLA